MRIQQITIEGFRNIGRAELTPGPGVNIFYGGNGAGKTSILEAIFVLCLGRSQRGAADSILVNADHEVYRVAGRIDDGNRTCEVAVSYQRNGHKRIKVDGIAARLTELYGSFRVVSLGPEDTTIVSGSPAVRRAFLDTYLSQMSRSYLRHLIDYQRALHQKNACLRQDQDPAAYDELLLDHGTEIMQARHEFVRQLDNQGARYYLQMSPTPRLRITYSPSASVECETTDPHGIRDSLRAALHTYQSRERRLQTALVGPHRDELVFHFGEHRARSYGSQGEWRAAAIAVKLAMSNILRQRHGVLPILLLDEIFAELDPSRSAALVGSLTELGQMFIAAAQDPPEAMRRAARNFRIVSGSVQERA